ncbi:MAG: mitofilin family membrane protein [Rhodospirillaceae bacterium]
MSGIKDVSADLGHADDLGNTKADEELGVGKKEPRSTHSDNSHKRFALLRGGLKSLVAVTTFFAIAWLTWPFWGGYTPNWVQEFVSPVMGLGRAEAPSREIDLMGTRIDILERKLDRIQSQLLNLTKNPVSSAIDNKVDRVISDLKGHREEHANLGDTMTAKSLSKRLEVVENQMSKLGEIKKFRNGALNFEDRLNMIENEIRTITDLGPGAGKALSESGANVPNGRGTMQRMAVVEEKTREFDRDFSKLTSRILELEKHKAAYSESSFVNRADGLLMFAIGNLKSVALTGDKFTKEWETTHFLASENPLVQEGLVSIKSLAESGVASMRGLQMELTFLADRATKISLPEDKPSWINRVLGRISSLVTVRRIGPNAAAGKDNVGLMAQAEISLSEGDLSGAINAISVLSGKQSELFTPWLAKARKRYQVEDTLDKATSVLFSKQKSPANK